MGDEAPEADGASTAIVVEVDEVDVVGGSRGTKGAVVVGWPVVNNAGEAATGPTGTAAEDVEDWAGRLMLAGTGDEACPNAPAAAACCMTRREHSSADTSVHACTLVARE